MPEACTCGRRVRKNEWSSIEDGLCDGSGPCHKVARSEALALPLPLGTDEQRTEALRLAMALHTAALLGSTWQVADVLATAGKFLDFLTGRVAQPELRRAA